MLTETAADVIETKFLEQEHRRIRDGIAVVQEVLGHAHTMTRPDAIDGVVRTLAWLRRDLLPHAAWEEAWLYPRLDAVARTPWATRVLRFEHEQIRDTAAALEREFLAAESRWTNEQACRLVAALTRLETLVSAHLAQEQWFVSPLLDLDEETRR